MLEDLCVKITSGGTPSRKRSEFFAQPPDGTPWVKSQELIDQRIKATVESITDSGLKGSSARLLPRDTVLIAMYGATVGQLGYLDIEATVNQAICALIVDPAVASSRFLYYVLMHVRDKLIELAHGAAQQNLSQQLIRTFAVSVPDMNQQRRIADVLTSIDDLIENIRGRVRVLEEMARAIYREWFVHFRFPDHEDATFVQSDLGPVPEEWATVPLTDVASFMNGFAFGPAHLGDKGRVVVKIRELKDGVTKETPRCDPNVIDEKYWIEPGDLLMSWSAHLGVYWWMDEPGLLNQHLFKVTSTADYTTVFLLYALDHAMPQLWDRAQGTTMRHIKRAALTEVRTLAPPIPLAKTFTAAVRPLLDSMLRLKKSADGLASIRDLILPRLVTGQIDVSRLDLEAVMEQAVV